MGLNSQPDEDSALPLRRAARLDAGPLWGTPRTGGLRGLSAWSRSIPEAAAGDVPQLQVWPWTAEEDTILMEHVRMHGTRKWKELVESGSLPKRGTKACCNRYRRLKLGQVAASGAFHHSVSLSPEPREAPAATTASAPLLEQTSAPPRSTVGMSPPLKKQRSEGAGRSRRSLPSFGPGQPQQEWDVTSSPPGTQGQPGPEENDMKSLPHAQQPALGAETSGTLLADHVAEEPSCTADTQTLRHRFVDADLDEWLAMGSTQRLARAVPAEAHSFRTLSEVHESAAPGPLQHWTQSVPTSGTGSQAHSASLVDELSGLEALLRMGAQLPGTPSAAQGPMKALQGSSKSSVSHSGQGHSRPQELARGHKAHSRPRMEADLQDGSFPSLPATSVSHGPFTSPRMTFPSFVQQPLPGASLPTAGLQQQPRAQGIFSQAGSLRNSGTVTLPTTLSGTGTADPSVDAIRQLARVSSDTTLVTLVRQLTEALQAERTVAAPAEGFSRGAFGPPGASLPAKEPVQSAERAVPMPPLQEAWGAGLSPTDLLRLLSASSLDSNSMGLPSPMADTPTTKGMDATTAGLAQLAGMLLDAHLREHQVTHQLPVRMNSAPQGTRRVKGEGASSAHQPLTSQGSCFPTHVLDMDKACTIEEPMPFRTRAPTAPRLSERYVQSSSWASATAQDTLSSGLPTSAPSSREGGSQSMAAEQDLATGSLSTHKDSLQQRD